MHSGSEPMLLDRCVVMLEPAAVSLAVSRMAAALRVFNY